MNLAYAFEVYKKDPEYRGFIDALINMSYTLYWEHNIKEKILKSIIEKTVGTDIAKHIVTLIMNDNTTFCKITK